MEDLKAHARVFPLGHVLFQEGELGREMYVVQSGKVRISKKVRQVEKILVTLGPGEFFGEMSILNNNPRSASALIEEEATLLVIGPKTFESMVRGNAEIAVRLIKKLSARLQEADEQIANLLLKDHNSRVVHFLTTQIAKGGKESPQGIMVEVTVKDIASKIGLEIEPINEVFARLMKARLVRLTATAVVVADPTRLTQYLEFLEMKEKFGDI